ncbi:uncharacterized protein LOC122709206 [Cervus elaphus]|uniref:uncharacterized protein LOC122709206 n=1 Tax=Cervus elaphus TaxID=9860 RepID=UPI001CC2724F|nr:uncharacterized protein LOC122709206 [Cervus elaphus]
MPKRVESSLSTKLSPGSIQQLPASYLLNNKHCSLNIVAEDPYLSLPLLLLLGGNQHLEKHCLEGATPCVKGQCHGSPSQLASHSQLKLQDAEQVRCCSFFSTPERDQLKQKNRDGEAHQPVHPNIPSPPERSTEPMDTKGSYQPCSKGTLTVVEALSQNVEVRVPVPSLKGHGGPGISSCPLAGIPMPPASIRATSSSRAQRTGKRWEQHVLLLMQVRPVTPVADILHYGTALYSVHLEIPKHQS